MKKGFIGVSIISLALITVLFFGATGVSASWFGMGSTNLISNLAKKKGIGEDKNQKEVE